MPLAAAVKVAVWPALTVVLLGLLVTVGAKSTVKVAAMVVTLRPAALLKTASYSYPFWAEVVLVKLRVVLVVPAMGLNVFPPSVLTCHWTVVGVGLPSLATAVKLAVCPALTVTLLGLLLTVGAKSTVSIAAVVVALRPAALLNTASYW